MEGNWPDAQELLDSVESAKTTLAEAGWTFRDIKVAEPEEEFPETPDATNYMVSKLLPEMANRIIEAGRHYGGSNHRILGIQGQFAELWRKIGPLKKQMWDGEEAVREPTREILMDLIGHCLLAVEMIDHGVPPGGRWVSGSE